MGNSSEPPSPQSIDYQRVSIAKSDANFVSGRPRTKACFRKGLDGNEIAASWLRNSLITVLCKGPRGERTVMWRTQCGKSLIFIYLRP